jgi:hypothetical protein
MLRLFSKSHGGGMIALGTSSTAPFVSFTKEVNKTSFAFATSFPLFTFFVLLITFSFGSARRTILLRRIKTRPKTIFIVEILNNF